MAPSISEDTSVTPVHTLLFVDIDGVLNVSIRQQGGPMLLLGEENANRAVGLIEKLPRQCSDIAQRLVSVWRHRLPQEAGGTYASLACVDNQETSAILVHRLAGLIRLAGEQRTVVLSSSWRHPTKAACVRELEKAISEHLNKPFAFDGATPPGEETEPSDRLRNLGDAVAKHCEQWKRDG